MPGSDLHLHTTISDGTLPPAEIVRRAAAAGLDVIAITDHDNTDGLPEALEEAKRFPRLTVIPGVELSSEAPEGEVHMLGYFTTEGSGNRKLQETILAFRDDRVGRAMRMVDRLAELGMPLSWERVLAIAGEGTIGRPHIALAMVEKGYVGSVSEAFDKWLGRDMPAYSERNKLTAEEAISMIHGAGGVACYAHALYTNQDRGALAALVKRLAEAGLDGIEVHYGRFSSEDRAWLLGQAQENNLLALGGSDYHGPEMAERVDVGQAGTPTEAGQAVLQRLRERARR